MKDVRVRITTQRKAEIKAIEKMKDAHIHELMKQHKEAFNEIKNYYNDITHNNLDLIKSLKEEVSDLKKSDVERSKSKDEIALKHKRMTEPLKRMRLEVAELKKQLEAYNEDKEKLKDAKEALMELEERHRVLEWENEVLTQRLEALEGEREQLKTSFNESIYEVQQKAGFKNLLLEKRLAAVSEEAETFEAQLGGVQQLTAQDAAGAAGGAAAAEGNEVLLEKQTMARELEQVGLGRAKEKGEREGGREGEKERKREREGARRTQLAPNATYNTHLNPSQPNAQELMRVRQKQNDVVDFFLGKMHEYGIPENNLGFVPLRTGL